MSDGKLIEEQLFGLDFHCTLKPCKINTTAKMVDQLKEDIRMSKLNISNFHTVIVCSAD